MPLKGAFYSKQVAKKGNKKTPISSFESTESSRSSSDIAEYPIKGKADTRGKRPARGKKIATPKDTPPRGPRMKNPSTSPSYSPSSLKDDEEEENKKYKGDARAEKEAESSSEEESLKNIDDEEVDTTLINRQDPPLDITPASVPTIEW